MAGTRKTKKKKSMTIVIGSSRLGANIASLMSKDGVYTAIIDSNADSFKKLDGSYSGYTVVGDATDKEVLEKAHIVEAKEAVITTGNDNLNVFLACMIAEFYPVPNIIVRLRDETKADLLDNERISIISTSLLSVQAYKSIRAQEEDL